MVQQNQKKNQDQILCHLMVFLKNVCENFQLKTVCPNRNNSAPT